MLLIATRSFPPEIGGMQSLMGGLAETLSLDYQTIVLADKFVGDKSYDDNKNYKIFRFGGFKFLKKLRKINFLKEIVRQNKFKKIIADHWKSVEQIPDETAKIIGIICLIHGKEINHEKNSSLNQRMLLAFKRTNFIVANSHFTKKLAINLGVEEKKIVVIHPGIYKPNEISNNDDLKSKKIFEDASIKIITVGRFDKRKGIDFSILALKNIKSIYPKFKYVIIGNGDEEDTLKNIVRSTGLENHVLFFKGISQGLKNALIKNSNFFLMPSRIEGKSVEGFGISYIEAASYEIPSIGGKDGGASDAIKHGETGYLCDGNNLEEIYENIKLMIENKKYLTLGKNAREFSKQFYWEKIIKDYKKIINS